MLTNVNGAMPRIAKKAEARICPACKVEFTPAFKKRHQVHCSIRCGWLTTKGPDYNAKISRESAFMRGESMRNRGAGNWYRKIFGKHEHRIVAENILRRSLMSSEIVHHIDGDKRNNTPENLEIVTRGQHMHRHGIGLPGVTPKHRPWEKRWGIK